MTNSRKWVLALVGGLLVAAIAFCRFSLATVPSASAAGSLTIDHRGGSGGPAHPGGSQSNTAQTGHGLVQDGSCRSSLAG